MVVPDPNMIWRFVVAFGLMLGGSFLPIPEEIVVMGSGTWVATSEEYGPLRWLILPICIAGILCCDMLLYSIGRHWGSRLLEHRWLARFLTREKLERIQGNFHRYGIKVLLFVRWIPGIRSPLFLTAGTMRLPVVRFVVADAVAATCGHTVLFMLSYWFGVAVQELYERLEHRVAPLLYILALFAILAVGLYLLLHFLRKPVPTGDPKELPIIGNQVAAKIESTYGSPETPKAEPPPPHPDGQAADQTAIQKTPG